MKKFFLISLVSIFLVAVLTGMFLLTFSLNKSAKRLDVIQISVSELSRKINEEQVNKIIINDETADIYLKSGKVEEIFNNKKVDLMEKLYDLGVDKNKLAKINIEIKKQTFLDYIFSVLLPFVLPFLIALPAIILIIWHIIRSYKNKK